MTLKVNADIGTSPPAEEDGVLPYIQREVHPVLKGVRRAVNDLAEFGWDRTIWRTSDTASHTVRAFSVQPGRAIAMTIDALATNDSGGGLSHRLEVVAYHNGTKLKTLMLDLNTGARYYGGMASGGAMYNYNGTNVEVQVFGDGTSLVWTVGIRAMVSFLAGDQA